VEIDGVVKVVPVPTKFPPLAASYQSMVVPAAVLADRFTVPVPHLEALTGDVGAADSGLTVMVTLDVEAVQGELLIVHRKTYEPAPPAGVNVAVGFVVLLNCAIDVLGPLTIDHSPVPIVGAFEASVTFPPLQTD